MATESRFLGIDYGTKRVGLAVSDKRGVLAFPKDILANDGALLQKIKEMIRREEITQIVVGESVNAKGEPNAIDADINIFISKLKEDLGLPVHSEKEFLTSVEARRYLEKQGGQARRYQDAGRADASAAALILQRYLDKINSFRA